MQRWHGSLLVIAAALGCGGGRDRRVEAVEVRDAAAPVAVDAPALAATASRLPEGPAGTAVTSWTWRPEVLAPGTLPAKAAFGTAVDSDRGRIVVGAPGGAGVAGAVHVFDHVRGAWAHAARLVAGPALEGFGSAVALDGDRVAVASAEGRVVIFEHRGVGWAAVATLVLAVQPGRPQRELALDLDGDTLAVGLKSWSHGKSYSAGVVAMYRRAGDGEWRLEATLTASDRQARADNGDNPEFGSRVALDGDTLAVSAVGATCTNGNAMCGAVYLFHRATGGWQEEQALPREDLARWALVGASLAIDGATVAVHVAGERRAWMLERTAAGWTETGTAALPWRDPALQRMGAEIAVDGGFAAVSDVGLWGDFTSPTLAADEQRASRVDASGTIHVFGRQARGWTQLATLSWPDGELGARLGASLAISDTVIVAGAPAARRGKGAVVVFSPSSPLGTVP